jgi:hypothetical protein
MKNVQNQKFFWPTLVYTVSNLFEWPVINDALKLTPCIFVAKNLSFWHYFTEKALNIEVLENF